MPWLASSPRNTKFRHSKTAKNHGKHMSGQNLASSVARPQEIEDGVRSVLETKRRWITPEGFLANVEEHRRKNNNDHLNPKPINHKPAEVRDY